MTVEEMLARMSSRELTEWQIVFRLRENERKKRQQQQGG